MKQLVEEMRELGIPPILWEEPDDGIWKSDGKLVALSEATEFA